MTGKHDPAKAHLPLNIDSVTDLITELQRPSGEIPWHVDGKTDPWDMVESIMALNIGGRHDAAVNGFSWLSRHQNPDGSWYSAYMAGTPMDRTTETNMAAYIAAGLFHDWLIRRDNTFLASMWPCMKKAIDFSLSLQTDSGEIYWARSPEGRVDPMALLTGCSSIYMSLKCAITIAGLLGVDAAPWTKAFDRLGRSIRNERHHYNISKSRFSMYWFYPVLSGAVTGREAGRRIESGWKKYVIDGQGARCVNDRPWVTIAETSELVLTLNAMGNRELAQIVFSWIQDRTFEDGSFWCGYTFPDMTLWPEEKISWTNGVVLMAADALYRLSPASRMFYHAAWQGCRFLELDR